MLILGMITGGLTLSRQNSVNNAVREATRYGAVVTSFDDSATNLSALYKQVVNAASGDLNPGVDGRFICVAFIRENNNWDYAYYGATDTPTAGPVTNQPAPSQCTDGFDATVGSGTERIWVQAERGSVIEGVVWSVPVTIKANSLTRYER